MRPPARGPDAPGGAWPWRRTGTDSVVLDLGRVQVGTGALALTEVMAAPRRSEGEWIELEAVAACDLAGWRLRDEGGEWRTVAAGRLAAGERVVLAQDAAALDGLVCWRRGREAAWPTVRHRPAVLELSGWPSLNNTAPADRAFAETAVAGRQRGHRRRPCGRRRCPTAALRTACPGSGRASSRSTPG